MSIKMIAHILPVALVTLLGASCAPVEKGDPHAGHNHGPGQQAASGTCSKHGAPVARCFICDPALREAGRLWCNEHDRYEDRCWDCHPDSRDKNREYCDEHGLYEDECFYCHPELNAPQVSKAEQVAALICSEHGVPEAECGICRPEMAVHLEPGQSLKVRLPSPESAGLAGIELATPATGEVSDGIACYAEISFNQNKLAQIAAPAGGVLREVIADLGDNLSEGDSVARIWSAAIAEAMARAVLSHQVLERERKLHADGIAAAKDLQEAEAAHRSACQQARTLGFSEEDIDVMGRKPDEPVLLDVRVPFTGEIIERNAVRGELVEAGRSLFTLADRSIMWAMLSIPETHLARVKVGQNVELEVDSFPGRSFVGKLTWISARVDEKTRMARARAEVANPDGALRDRMFARARIVLRHTESALLLPATAVQQVDATPIVFVKQDNDLYDARAVRLGARFNGRVEVLAGLRPDEPVVVGQAFLVKSQLLISRLGAGCAHE